MKVTKQRLLFLSLFVTLLVTLLVACGRNTSNTTTTNTPTTAAQEEEQQDDSSQSLQIIEDSDETTNTTSEQESETSGTNVPIVAMQSKLLNISDRSPVKKGVLAPDFSYTLADGKTYTLSDMQGKKVMINFWATWCPPCNAEMPDIQDAMTKFEDDGFTVLAVSQDLETNLIEPFGKKYALTFPLIADPQGEIGRRYGVRGMPSSYFLNSDGTVNTVVQGMVNINYIEKVLEQME